MFWRKPAREAWKERSVRLWHLLYVVAAMGLVMTLARDPMSRVMLIVVATGIGEVVFGLTAVMALFQTIGALGEARGLFDHAEALAATSFVLAVGSAVMCGWLVIGMWLISVYV
jgi:hypothetical protein